MEASMIDFVKAMADPQRLRIIGALSRGGMKAAQVAEATGMSAREAFNHLAFLEFVHVVVAKAAEQKQDEIYELDTAFLDSLARENLGGTRPSYPVEADANELTRRTLKKYLNTDGTIRQIPNTRNQYASFQIILHYVLAAFEAERTYSEREVNEILKRFHADIAGLRRDLVDAGLLGRERDGSKYWRVENPARQA